MTPSERGASARSKITTREMVSFLRAWRDKANELAANPYISDEQRAQCRLEAKMFTAIVAQMYRQGSSHNPKRKSR